VDFDDPEVTRRELRRQFDLFVAMTGQPPTHLDSHQHVHRRPSCQPSFLELALEYRLPLRDRVPVTFKGGFYGQWEHGISEQEKVSFAALTGIVSTELRRGIYELAVHPGYHDSAADYVYHRDREWERATLADPRLPGLLRDQGVELISYHELNARSRLEAARPEPRGGSAPREAEISAANSTRSVPWIVSSDRA
jgi:predicted glycoside hydrolase/deacetylase ChbG (UPF0249 family)